jgi:S-adenosylmethionine decarboxylase proenzyme
MVDLKMNTHRHVTTIKPKDEFSIGCHYICDFVNCNSSKYFDMPSEILGNFILNAAQSFGFNVLKMSYHQFQPTGSSGTVILAESHIAWHTWPEYGRISFDIYACEPTEQNEIKIKKLEKFFSGMFQPKYNYVNIVYR